MIYTKNSTELKCCVHHDIFALFNLKICLFTLNSLNDGLFLLKKNDHSLKTLPCTTGGLTNHKKNPIHLTRFLPCTYMGPNTGVLSWWSKRNMSNRNTRPCGHKTFDYRYDFILKSIMTSYLSFKSSNQNTGYIGYFFLVPVRNSYRKPITRRAGSQWWGCFFRIVVN